MEISGFVAREVPVFQRQSLQIIVDSYAFWGSRPGSF